MELALRDGASLLVAQGKIDRDAMARAFAQGQAAGERLPLGEGHVHVARLVGRGGVLLHVPRRRAAEGRVVVEPHVAEVGGEDPAAHAPAERL